MLPRSVLMLCGSSRRLALHISERETSRSYPHLERHPNPAVQEDNHVDA